MKLKLDENLGRHIAILFRDAGHDVATVPDQGLSGAEDRQIIPKEKGKDDDDSRKVVKPGLVLLRLATEKGTLAIEF